MITRAGAVAIMSDLVNWPAVGVAADGLLDLLLVTLGGRAFRFVCIVVMLFSFETLSQVCGMAIYRSRSAFDTEVLQISRQVPSFILWVVTDDVVPPVTVVASDSVAVIVAVSAKAAYLSVVLVCAVHRRHGVSAILNERVTVWQVRVCEVRVPGYTRGRVEVLCHAITPERVCFESGFK